MSAPALARGYLWLMAIAAAGMQGYWLQAWRGSHPTSLGLVVLLIVLASVAQHFPVRVGRQRKVDVSASAYFASLLLFGAPLAVAVVGLSQLVGQSTLALRRNALSGKRLRTPRSVLFNTSQAMVVTGLGALVYYAFVPHTVPAPLDGWVNLWAIPAAAGTMYLGNSLAVAIMAGLHLGQHPMRIWATGRRSTLLEFTGLFLIGLVVARAGTHDPLIVPAMVLPAAVIYWSLERTVRLEEHARREAELTAWRDLEQMKTEFLRSITHELSTPVSLVCGFSELLRSQVAETPTIDSEISGLAEKLYTHSRLLARLMDDLLDFASIERGEILLQPADFDLVPVLQDLLEALRQQVGGHRLVGLWPATLPVHGDPARVAQAVFNLVANGLKYAPEGPVTLRAELVDHQAGHGHWVRVHVEDRGPGIPVEEQPLVWKRFYRGHAVAGLHSAAGAGIGLAMVKAVVEAQGGCVGLHSAPGQGAHFWIELPSANEPLATESGRLHYPHHMMRLFENPTDHPA